MELNRKLKMGMIGGGPGAFIGEVHRRTSRLDGQVELVAGASDINPGKSGNNPEEANHVCCRRKGNQDIEINNDTLKYKREKTRKDRKRKQRDCPGTEKSLDLKQSVCVYLALLSRVREYMIIFGRVRRGSGPDTQTGNGLLKAIYRCFRWLLGKLIGWFI